MSSKTTMIIAAVAIIAIAAAAIVILNPGQNGGDSDDKITFIDGAGVEIELDGPLDSIVSINTLPAIAMKILGLEDKVDEILFYKTVNKYEYYHNAGFNNISPDTPFYYELETADYFIENGMEYLVVPISASKINDSLKNSCLNNGITLISLDCFGDSMLDDMETLLKMFGNPADAVEAFNDYKSLRNGVIDTVLEKSVADKTNLFLYEFVGISSFYKENAEMSIITEKIAGEDTNAVRLMNLPVDTKISTSAKGLGPLESLTAIDSETPIKYLFLRASAGDDAADLEGKWGKNVIKDYKLSYLETDSVFCIDSDLLTGSMDYIGYVCTAEILGCDTGYDINELVSQYEELYGFHKEIDTNIWQFLFDEEGNLTGVVDFEDQN